VDAETRRWFGQVLRLSRRHEMPHPVQVVEWIGGIESAKVPKLRSELHGTLLIEVPGRRFVREDRQHTQAPGVDLSESAPKDRLHLRPCDRRTHWLRWIWPQCGLLAG